ncbi:MAG: hypothetical protein DWQ37_00650 [Planctomycetota bacterium]|nr:MAG: hypothetical protein DWQ37_00650 [Planctomycetota bacterium]
MLEFVLALLLSVHLLAVDLAMMGPLACVWLEWRGARSRQPGLADVGRRLAVLTIWALVGGSALGMLMLLLRYQAGDGSYISALASIPRNRLWFGLVELLFSLICLCVYLAAWNRLKNHRLWHRLFAVAAATNLLMHFPALFSVVSVVGTRPGLVGQTIDRDAYRRLLIDPEVLSRVAHVWLAAAAVTGVVLMALGARIIARGEESGAAVGRQCVTQGALAALAATVMQFPAGIWVALAMPEDSRQRLLGGDWLVTGCFAASLLLALLLMHMLSAAAQGDAGQPRVRRLAGVLTLLTFLMVGTRLRLNELASVPAGRPAAAAPSGGAVLASTTRSASIGGLNEVLSRSSMEWLIQCP